MTVAIIIITAVIALFLLYVLSTTGRVKHPGIAKLHGWAYAHRGLHDDIAPENSMKAFRLAKEAGYGVELDVHLLSDGALAVFHDATLDRMTGREGRIDALKSEQLTQYHLAGTDETIPLFQDVLSLFDGKVPLIVELKSGKGYPKLCKQTCEMLDKYNGTYCIESFDPRCVRWLKKNRPDVIRGQLCQNYHKSRKSRLPWILKVLLSNHVLNFLTMPDFVAYKFEDRKRFSNTLARKFWKLQGVSWTIRSKKDYDLALEEGWLPIFEGFRP